MISQLGKYEQAVLMAQLSEMAYTDNQDFGDLGFESVFISNSGSEAYFLYNDDDAIIVCRGTQPTHWDDIKADLEFRLVESMGNHGRVHHGFKEYVDDVWANLIEQLEKVGDKKLWCTGHSLGAAMATLITSRCYQLENVPNPTLFTFGSPRVGDRQYVEYMNSIGVKHHRWVNNTDIVTRNPIGPYHHHGELNYFDHSGTLATLSWAHTEIDRIEGLWVGLEEGKLSYFSNHFMANYIKNLKEIQQ